MGLTGKLLVQATLEQTNPLDLGSGIFAPTKRKLIELASGVGANQADRLFTDQRTLAASTAENLDLAGVLVDAFGATLTFARVKAIIVEAAAGNVNNVVVGGHASAAFVGWVSDATDKIVVPPSGVFSIFAPGATAWPVTPTTADLLTIANSGAGSTVTYDIMIIGASA